MEGLTPKQLQGLLASNGTVVSIEEIEKELESLAKEGYVDLEYEGE